MKNIQERHDEIQVDCLDQIGQLRSLLESLEHRIRDKGFVLNDLGEIQGMCNILDCRIAALATLRSVLFDIEAHSK